MRHIFVFNKRIKLISQKLFKQEIISSNFDITLNDRQTICFVLYKQRLEPLDKDKEGPMTTRRTSYLKASIKLDN